MGKLIKHILLGFIFVVLLLNIFQDILKISALTPRNLDGYYVPAVKDTFTLDKWFSGTYAEKTNAYLNEQFGFRRFYVRFNNQLRFSLFKKSGAVDFIIGKENFLYQWGYVLSYNGSDFKGERSVADSVANLKLLEGELNALSKKLLVVIAPSKVRIYPEYLPDHLQGPPAERSFYNSYVKELKASGIHFIDFNNWYAQKKVLSENLLMPQLGMHWSRLEAMRAVDSIASYVGILCNAKMPRVKITRTYASDSLESPDDDAIKSLNLMYLPEFKKMTYPEIKIEGTENAKLNALVISDSYWWDIYGREIPLKIFKNNEFWYYGRDAYGTGYGKADALKFDVKRHILQSDFVVILCTESNLRMFGYGFISRAIRGLKEKLIPTQEELNDYKEAIQKNPEWMKDIVRKAAANKVSVDSMLVADAVWMLQRRGPLNRGGTLEEIIQRIKNEPAWLEMIRKQAKEKHINLDTCIMQNALYTLNKNKGL